MFLMSALNTREFIPRQWKPSVICCHVVFAQHARCPLFYKHRWTSAELLPHRRARTGGFGSGVSAGTDGGGPTRATVPSFCRELLAPGPAPQEEPQKSLGATGSRAGCTQGCSPPAPIPHPPAEPGRATQPPHRSSQRMWQQSEKSEGASPARWQFAKRPRASSSFAWQNAQLAPCLSFGCGAGAGGGGRARARLVLTGSEGSGAAPSSSSRPGPALAAGTRRSRSARPLPSRPGPAPAPFRAPRRGWGFG